MPYCLALVVVLSFVVGKPSVVTDVNAHQISAAAKKKKQAPQTKAARPPAKQPGSRTPPPPGIEFDASKD